MLVFVYGTLKRDKHNHYMMGNSRYLRDIELPVKGILYWNDKRNFPHFVEDESGDFITGELYEVDEQTALSLDIFEGNPKYFRRKSCQFESQQVFYYEYVGYQTFNEDLNKFHKIKSY